MNASEPSGGTVVLRGHTIEIGSDIGHSFVLDICRHIEDLINAEALRTKYGLSDEGTWQQLATNEPLQRAIAAAKTRRIHDGSAAREKAAHHFVQAPDVLNEIVQNSANSPRHRVDAIRELRACAQVGPEAVTTAGERERFTININFGNGHTLHKELELKPVKTEEELQLIEHNELIEPEHDEDDEREAEYGF
jgi:hypothetical protein